MTVGELRFANYAVWALLVHLIAGLPQAWALDSFLTDSAVPIARHEKRPTSVRFAGRAAIETSFGRIFSPGHTGAQPEEQEMLSYRELPRCGKSEVALLELRRSNPMLEAFDVVYYDHDDAEQSLMSQRYSKRSVAYQPALVKDPKTKDTDLWQTFARFINIDCLPTRFHLIEVGGRVYMEFRKGALAWYEDINKNAQSAMVQR